MSEDFDVPRTNQCLEIVCEWLLSLSLRSDSSGQHLFELFIANCLVCGKEKDIGLRFK